MEEPVVSVVIPVFNGAEYLEECLTSILAQTYGRWEGFLINNCSTDNTRQIAESFAQRDPRLQVVNCSEFVSQSENYNRAIAHASPGARYIKIVEADNWIAPDCLERMLPVAEQDHRVGLVGAYYHFFDEVHGTGLPIGTRVVEGSAVCRMHMLDNVYFLGAPTTLLFRAEALRSLPMA